jgi:hypothetical protein
MSTATSLASNPSISALLAARRVADLASSQGVTAEPAKRRPVTYHVGAILADSVLQAGVSYSAVVLPRVCAILSKFPDACRVSQVAELVAQERTGEFLSWEHPEKISRFNSLVGFLVHRGVDSVDDLRARLSSDSFGEELQSIKGVGPKTVDYLACLVGIDSVAVDRHVRSFARMAGVESSDYRFLRATFCYAADLLCLSRRDFDAWIWRRQSSLTADQLPLAM